MDVVLPIIIFASWAFWISSAILVWVFFHKKRKPYIGSYPAVSILKPVKGLDAEAYENFASFCRQDFPVYEILFGVADPTDPAIPIIRQLQTDFPDVNIKLYVIEPDAANRKISLLSNLETKAKNPILVVSDSDMRVTPDYLCHVVSPLHDDKVGLVTCPYIGIHAHTFTARLEALYMGVVFLPSVFVARQLLHMRFAMGATVVIRKRDLARMGGFEILADYLADDYQLGYHISQMGLQVYLSDYIMRSVLGETSFKDQWKRELRWSQCNRVSKPTEYPGLLITFSVPLSIILFFTTGMQFWALELLLGSLIVRYLVGYSVTEITQDREARRWLFILPLRDCLSALIWIFGLFGTRVYWRGEAFQLLQGGRLAASTHNMQEPWVSTTSVGLGHEHDHVKPPHS